MNALLTRADVDRIVTDARKAGITPNLGGADLRGADLRGADLRGADLRDADLRGADLRDANLRYANLRYANLRGADLRDANLRDANLRYANLGYADLRDANLRYANLRGASLGAANLGAANLGGADFRYATGAVGVALGVSGLPSGIATLYPTRDGWLLTVGCWQGTPTSLVEMIAGDTGWPEAVGVECDYRRPSLTALLVLCGDHMRRHEGVVADLAARWPADAGAES